MNPYYGSVYDFPDKFFEEIRNSLSKLSMTFTQTSSNPLTEEELLEYVYAEEDYSNIGLHEAPIDPIESASHVSEKLSDIIPDNEPSRRIDDPAILIE